METVSIFDALFSPEPLPLRYERRKLTAAQVTKIRDAYARSPRPTQAQLGEEFGVTQPQISKIVNGVQWPTEEK